MERIFSHLYQRSRDSLFRKKNRETLFLIKLKDTGKYIYVIFLHTFNCKQPRLSHLYLYILNGLCSGIEVFIILFYRRVQSVMQRNKRWLQVLLLWRVHIGCRQCHVYWYVTIGYARIPVFGNLFFNIQLYAKNLIAMFS